MRTKARGSPCRIGCERAHEDDAEGFAHATRRLHRRRGRGGHVEHPEEMAAGKEMWMNLLNWVAA